MASATCAKCLRHAEEQNAQSSCRFQHNCKFFAAGKCKNRHVLICINFPQGKCTRGDSCHFLHNVCTHAAASAPPPAAPPAALDGAAAAAADKIPILNAAAPVFVSEKDLIIAEQADTIDALQYEIDRLRIRMKVMEFVVMENAHMTNEVLNTKVEEILAEMDAMPELEEA